MDKQSQFWGNSLSVNSHTYKRDCCIKHRSIYREERGPNGYRTKEERENREKIICDICGDIFTPTHKHYRYCSNICSDEAIKRSKIKELENARKLRKKIMRYCKYCGCKFNPAVTGRKKYCSNKHYFLDKYGREEPHEREKICEWCGRPFKTRISKARACPYHAKKLAKWERKLRLRAVVHIPYSRWEIFQRDHFTCHICGNPIDMNAVAPTPYSPSLDHVIPIDHGGADADYNVKAAHFICNSKKSNRLLQ